MCPVTRLREPARTAKRYCEYGVSLKRRRDAKAGSPDGLAWPQGATKAMTALPPEAIRLGESCFRGRTTSAGNDFITVGLRKLGTKHCMTTDGRNLFCGFRCDRESLR